MNLVNTEATPIHRVLALVRAEAALSLGAAQFSGAQESLVQASALLLLHGDGARPTGRVFLRGVDDAKFRRQVVPGDRVRLEVTRLPGRGPLARVHGVSYIGDQVVAEANLLLAVVGDVTADEALSAFSQFYPGKSHTVEQCIVIHFSSSPMFNNTP